MLVGKHLGDHLLGIIWPTIGNAICIPSLVKDAENLKEGPMAPISSGRSKLGTTATSIKNSCRIFSAAATSRHLISRNVIP